MASLVGLLGGWALVEQQVSVHEMWDLVTGSEPRFVDLARSVADDKSKYRMLIQPAGNDVTLCVFDGDEEVFTWSGNPDVPFVRDGDTLYLAEFHPKRTGCCVLAYDLAERKQV